MQPICDESTVEWRVGDPRLGHASRVRAIGEFLLYADDSKCSRVVVATRELRRGSDPWETGLVVSGVASWMDPARLHFAREFSWCLASMV